LEGRKMTRNRETGREGHGKWRRRQQDVAGSHAPQVPRNEGRLELQLVFSDPSVAVGGNSPGSDTRLPLLSA
jgi:hypothetical protein